MAIDGLSQTTLYHVAVFSFAGSGSLVNYQWDSPATGSQATISVTIPTLSSPTAPFVTIGTTNATLGATVDTLGDTNIFARGTVWNVSSNPVANALAEGGTNLGAYSHLRTGLDPGTHYYYRGYATNSVGIGYSSDGEFWTEPDPASSPALSTISSSNMTLTWSVGAGTGCLVLVKAGGVVDATPGDGTNYSANSIFPTGDEIGTGNRVVFAGIGTNVTITGLSEATAYYVAIFTYAGSGTMINYQQDNPALTNATTETESSIVIPLLSSPTAPFSGITITSAVLGASVDDTGGTNLIARGTLWGAGASPSGNLQAEGLTNAGAFSHTRGSLSAGTHYYYRGYATNSVGIGYSPDGEFWTEPNEATDVSFSAVTATTMQVSWTGGSGRSGSVVLVKLGVAVDTNVADGVTYTANPDYGDGTELGTGNYVVYQSTGLSVVVTGLLPNITYHVAVFEYAGTNTLRNYQQDDPALGSEQTIGPPPVEWIAHNTAYGIQCKSCHFLHSGTAIARGLEQESTVCGSCHSPTGVATNKSDVSVHYADGTNTITDCGTCHEVHGGGPDKAELISYDARSGLTKTNLTYFRVGTNYMPIVTNKAVFHERPAHFAFTNTAPWDAACQICHTGTTHHTRDDSQDHSHKGGTDCMTCHTHVSGFSSAGGTCLDCHASAQDNDDGPPTRRAVVNDFTNISHHVVGGDVTEDDCAVCHYEAIDDDYHMDNTIDLRDPDNGTSLISFTNFTRNLASSSLEPWVAAVQSNFCLHCHDSDGATSTFYTSALQPFSSNSKDVPDVMSRILLTNSFHHAIWAPGTNEYCTSTLTNGNFTTMELPWNQSSVHNKISCFDCHLTNLVHGVMNQRSLVVPIDFDTMEAVTVKTELPSGMGATVETFCLRCHKASVYRDHADPEDVGSIYMYHGGGQSGHAAADGNELGCMGCHGGVVDLSGLTGGNASTRLNIHGGSYTWTEEFASGSPADYFCHGGWYSGWEIVGSTGYCRGGDCKHGNSSQNYPR
ncbi:MAG: hypothetical protein HQ582_18660 [Planctomycetes bacterium]|nr:hypothetical protein [Planctomycetota bacterium]